MAKELAKREEDTNAIDITDVVSQLSDEQKVELAVTLAESRVESTFSGPIPAPEHFEMYERVLPGAAERILGMAEREQEIRAEGQVGMLSNDRRKINGTIFLGALLLGIAALAAWRDNNVLAITLGFAGTIAFLVRRIVTWLDRSGGRN